MDRGKLQKLVKQAIVYSLVFMALMPTVALADRGKRAKVIDFDDEVVEGLNKRPLDSLSQISEKNRRKKKPHLYRKRASFRSETVETLRAIRFTSQ